MASFVAVVLVFAGLVTYNMGFAATGVFTNPECDPITNPNCNPSAPLFLNPDDGLKQTVQTDIDLGSGKALGVFGNLNLNTGAKLQTPSALAGQAINVTSSGDHAIVGRSDGTSKNGIYGIASATGSYGVYAINTANTSGSYALFADGGSSGNAAQFTGPVIIKSNNGSYTATLGVDSSNRLTVNGSPAGAAQHYATATGTASATTTYNIISNLGDVTVTSIQVLYADTSSGTNRFWNQLPQANIVYEECESSAPDGALKLTNPTANTVGYRIVIGYDATTAISCPGAIPVPTFSLSASSIAANQSVTSSSTGVNNGLTSTWTVGGVTVCTGTNPSGACSFTNSAVTVSNTLAAPTFVFKTGAAHTITLNNGNATVPSATVNTYLANMAQVSLRSPATNYIVNFNNTSTPSPVTGLVCDWNYGSGFSGTYSACATPQSNNFVTGGNKTVYLRVKKTAGDATYSEKQTSFELCTAANQATDCASGICAASGYCVVGGGGGGLPID